METIPDGYLDKYSLSTDLMKCEYPHKTLVMNVTPMENKVMFRVYYTDNMGHTSSKPFTDLAKAIEHYNSMTVPLINRSHAQCFDCWRQEEQPPTCTGHTSGPRDCPLHRPKKDCEHDKKEDHGCGGFHCFDCKEILS